MEDGEGTSAGAATVGRTRIPPCAWCMAAWNCAVQQNLLSARSPAGGGTRSTATNTETSMQHFHVRKPSSRSKDAPPGHLGDGGLPRCRHHERAGAPWISSGRHERRALDDASRGLGAPLSPSPALDSRKWAPQPIVISRNGLGNGRAASASLARRRRPRARCVQMKQSSTHLKSICCSEFGVRDNDEFSHDCGDGDEGLFACAEETFVEGAEGRVVFLRRRLRP